MRRLIIWAVLAAGMFLAMRKMADKAAPAMRAKCSEMCDRMLANMPGSFPPNRIMADLAAVKEQTARILEVLEERQSGTSRKSKDAVVETDCTSTPTLSASQIRPRADCFLPDQSTAITQISIAIAFDF